MNLFFYGEAPANKLPSIFLAGPTPRRETPVGSWRPGVVNILRQQGFKGNVFIPEPPSGKWQGDYDDHVGWEQDRMEDCTVALFWVPRDFKRKMPGLTTNVEFGLWVKSGKVTLGFPEHADKMRYLQWLLARHQPQEPVFHSRQKLVQHSIKKALLLHGVS